MPGPGRLATNIADVINAGGTFYLLGRDDPYASASPLMTALAEHILDNRPATGQLPGPARQAVPAVAGLPR